MSKSQGYQFINPYNFIPFGTKREKASSEEEKNRTGVIEYSVLTKTRLFIPNTSSDNAFNTYKEEEDEKKRHKSYDFFTYTDLTGKKEPAKDAMPVIPGSEIRGMFRSNFEILTNSCLSAVDDDVPLSMRTNVIYQAGLLKRIEQKDSEGKAESSQKKYRFELYDADSYRVKIKQDEVKEKDTKEEKKQPEEPCVIDPSIIKNQENDFHEGALVFFDYNTKNKKVTLIAHSKTNMLKEKGYLLKGYPGGKKKHCHIFVPKGKKADSKISCETFERLDAFEKLNAVLKAYEKEGVHPYTEYKEQLESFKTGKSNETFFPVFYSKLSYINSKDNAECLVLSPAAITRESYSRKIKDMVEGFQSCDDKKNLCPACSLFGTVVQKGKSSFGVTSRIRFSDLTCDEDSAEKCYRSKVTLAPLSSPKLNNMEFYLQRPASDAIFWTYDYYIDKKGTLHPNECGINGRKFYWHNMSPDLNGYKPSNLNITVRPVKAGVRFRGKMYFQNISTQELNQLIYLLNAGEKENIKIEDRTHGYKLGGAKPLGLGSVAVSVDQVLTREIKKIPEKQCVERMEIPYDIAMEDTSSVIDPTLQNDFEKMTRFDFVQRDISYPKTNELDEDGNPVIYAWFVKNHVKKEKDGSYNSKAMPTSRTEMAYAEYMEPMKMDLQSTQKEGSARFAHQNRSEKDVHTTGPFVCGNLYAATVVGYNKNCTSAKIQIGTEARTYSLYFEDIIPKAQPGKVDKSLPLDMQVVVEYTGDERGSDGKMHAQFKMRPKR